MLAKALHSIDQHKPDPPAVLKPSSPSGLPPVSSMILVLTQIKRTTHMVSAIVSARRASSKLADWRHNARRAAIPSHFHELVVAAFEAVDQNAHGTITQLQANVAFRELLSSAEHELGVCCDEVVQQLELLEGPVSSREFLLAIGAVQFPEGLQSAAQKAIHGLQCVCGSWMTKKARQDCYPGGAVRCDFTGESAEGDHVWHCDRQGSDLHPFGFDVAGESLEPFREFQTNARLHDRLRSLKGSEEGLRERRAKCTAALVPHIFNIYLSVKDDLTNARAAGRNVTELETRMLWCQSVLQRQDWAARKTAARAQVGSTLGALQQFCDSLSHDNLRFRDRSHREHEIARFTTEFEPAARHARFEQATLEFRKVCAFVKDLVGHAPFDPDDPDAAQLMVAFGQQILVGLMQQRGLMFVEIERSFEQIPQGVKFRWKLAVAPSGQQIVLDHVLALDQSDIEHAHMHRDFMSMYHEVQDRIKGLEQCATEEDLLDALTGFSVASTDECCGDVCVICQDDMCLEDDALTINSCGHCFHRDCVNSWLLGCKQECPICKAPVKAQNPERRFSQGQRVLLEGLVARPEFNRLCGEVLGMVGTAGRYRVSTRHGVLSVLARNMIEQPVEGRSTRGEVDELTAHDSEHECCECGARKQVDEMDEMDEDGFEMCEDCMTNRRQGEEEEKELQAALALSLELTCNSE